MAEHNYHVIELENKQISKPSSRMIPGTFLEHLSTNRKHLRCKTLSVHFNAIG